MREYHDQVTDELGRGDERTFDEIISEHEARNQDHELERVFTAFRIAYHRLNSYGRELVTEELQG